jgi:hypothetical protein
VEYALKPGFKFKPDDLVPIMDEPAADNHAAPARVRSPSGARAVNPNQHALDLRERKGPPPPPWAEHNPHKTVGFTTTVTDEMHKKLIWIKENVPNSSIAAVVRRALEAEVARCIEKYYHPEGE